MGRGATATIERLAASLGGLDEAAPRFDPALDVSKGGVLLALPALLACGLLRHSGKYFRLPAGFYGLKTIFLLLAFMALARLKSIEALRYYAPGEWGKLLGLDRAPEVRTLRVKVKTLADQNQAFSWSSELCKEWMAEAPQEAAVLYVDGHVRVYYGNTKQLPKHYIARERLCSASSPRVAIKPHCFPLITNPRRRGWARPCLHDGRRKTSSDICGKAIIWMPLLTMVPTLFLTPPWW